MRYLIRKYFGTYCSDVQYTILIKVKRLISTCDEVEGSITNTTC